MKIVFFGLSITSSWGNGHATTYRALLKALAQRGHSLHFIEKDVEWYRHHRDLGNPNFCAVHLYEAWTNETAALVTNLCIDADAVVIGSYFEDTMLIMSALLAKVLAPIFFYDIDTPITLAGLRKFGSSGYLDASLIPLFTAYLSFTAGPALVELEQTFGARQALAFFCSVDQNIYFLQKSQTEFACDLSYMGTFAVDRQDSLMRYLDGAAALLPKQAFIVAGSQYPAHVNWQDNVKRLDHVSPAKHPVLYSSSRFTLNLTRNDMIVAGYSPSVRLFEASACGAAIISDSWSGLENFFTAGEEILLPRDEYEVASILTNMPDAERQKMGSRARDRVLSLHTAAHRAQQFEDIVASF